MAATGKTPILLYGSTTATNTPSAGNLTNSSDGCEIAINVADKNLFFKDSGNVVNTVPIRQSSASSNGWLSSTDWSTFNGKQAALVSGTNIKTVSGTTLLGSGDLGTIGTSYGGTGLTSFNANGVMFASSTSVLATSSICGINATGFGSGTTSPAYRIDARSGATATTAQFTSTDATAYNAAAYNGGSARVMLIGGGASGALNGIRFSSGGNNENYVGYVQEAGGAGAFVVQGYTGAAYAEQFRVASTGDTTVTRGNLVIGTSGKGIDFSATPGTGTSELLADYEEGTWTPGASAATGTITTVGATAGRYTKVGRLVTVWATVTITTNGTGANALNITGLPYTPVSGISYYNGLLWNDTTAKTGAAIGQPASTTLVCRYYDATYPVASGQTVSIIASYNV